MELATAQGNQEFIDLFRSSVFVFGSNLQGIHGAGAARFARQFRGAELGVGEGPTGSCYALPTKATPIDKEKLELGFVAERVQVFLDYARAHPDVNFQVSAIGCGLAGFTDAQIAPLFSSAPDNCWLPGKWVRMLREPALTRVIIAGGREFNDQGRAYANLGAILRRVLQEGRPLQVVSGRARGADTLGERWAAQAQQQWPQCFKQPLSHAPFPAQWERFERKSAGPIRNQEMSWYGTHLIAFWDGQSRGTRNMIETAKRDGLVVRIVDVSSKPGQEV